MVQGGLMDTDILPCRLVISYFLFAIVDRFFMAMASLLDAFLHSLFLLLLLIPNPVAARYSALFVFGNSLTDTGNLAYLGGDLVSANRLPYGETYFRRPAGRFSDGRLVVDFIAQALGLPLIPPYLAGNNSEEHFQRGANFAVAGACALNNSFFLAQGMNVTWVDYSLNTQLSWFDQYQGSSPSSKRLPQPPNLDHFVRADAELLFFLGEMGINDYTRLLVDKGVSSTDIQTYVPIVVRAIGATIDSLIQRRAETMVVAGIYPIGCSACYLTLFQQDLDPKTGCVEWVNDLVRCHNLQLQLELKRLRRTHRHSKILYADYYAPMMHLYLHPGKFGVRETLTACCGGEGPYNFSLSIACGSPGSSLCSDPSSYACWDGLHLTEAAYSVVARHILKSTGLGS